ncbi:hypothetical protein MMC14_003082 [Varicellaria rhodocarpa]|nr:hypothetical protein [Varicellaria rhodocarpa]
MEPESHKRRTQIDMDGLTRALRKFEDAAPILRPVEHDPVHKVPNTNKVKGNSILAQQDKPSPSSLKKPTLSAHDVGISPRSGLLELSLCKAVKAGRRAYEYVRVKNGSPWGNYNEKYELKFEDFATVAVSKGPSNKLVTIKKMEQAGSREQVTLLQRLQHDSFVQCLEIFEFDQSVYVVSDYIAVSLGQLIRCPAYPDESQLAAILAQASLCVQWRVK